MYQYFRRRLVAPGLDQWSRKVIPYASVRLLNDPAVVLVPGVPNSVLVFLGALITKPAGTAYDGVDAGEDLAVKYTDKDATLVLGTCETTGFVDQATAQYRWLNAYHAASGASDITPAIGAPLVLHMLVGNIATGNSPLIVHTHFRIVKPT